jgi:High potential iron-sulfur protein
MSMATKFKEISRRGFCKCSATTALSAMVLVTLGPKPAAAKAKMTQKQAAYQGTPKGDQQCDKCKLFQPPSACTSVEGDISPKGWCNIFQPIV